MGIRLALRATTLALTIEHGFVKLLETKGRRVMLYKAVPVNPDFFREGLVAQPSRVARALGSAVAELGEDRRRRIVAAAPGFQGNLGVVELPKTRQRDLGVVLPREASAALGVALERSVVRWHSLADWQERRRWLVASTTRRSVDTLLETARHARLQVRAMELRPFALARAANQREAIIAWAATDGADVVVVRDALPVAYQSLSWGAEPLEEDVLVERVTQMVERTLRIAEERDPLGWIGEEAPLYVCGSAMAIEGAVGPRVAESLGRTLGQLTPPMEYPEEMPVQDFIVNIGLALGEA